MHPGTHKSRPHCTKAHSPSTFNTLGRENGQTLVELAISMVIFSIVMAALYGAHVAQANGHWREQQLRDAQQTVRLIESMVTRDLQRAGYDPTNASFLGLTYDPAQLQIRADLDADGATTSPSENVVYSYDAGQLRLVRNIGSAQVEFRGIQAFTYSYLDANGTPTTTSADIRQVHLSVTARTSQPDPEYPLNGGYRTFAVNFRVAARNLAS